MSRNHPLLTAAPPCPPAKNRWCTTNLTLLPTLTSTWYAYAFSVQLPLLLLVHFLNITGEEGGGRWDGSKKGNTGHIFNTVE